ncbi:MAG TPA: hypothetical protein VGM46_10510 [Mesorhizobium sp.]|jgi:hypothetical protein
MKLVSHTIQHGVGYDLERVARPQADIVPDHFPSHIDIDLETPSTGVSRGVR